jgi:predicted phosphoadenosine phosphosulfate sulfurtransferase
MLSAANLSKPSSKKWKSVADFFLYTMPLYLSTIMALPITEDLKLWINFGITMLTITLKAVSKFTSEDEE